MLEEEKAHREQVLEAKYRDMANLETKFTQLIETEVNVRNFKRKRVLRIFRQEKKAILDLLELLMNVSMLLEVN